MPATRETTISRATYNKLQQQRMLLGVACCVLALLCIGLFIFNPRVVTKTVPQDADSKPSVADKPEIVEKEVVKEVIKEVPKFVEKVVIKEVPGPLPAFFRKDPSIAQYMDTVADVLLTNEKTFIAVDAVSVTVFAPWQTAAPVHSKIEEAFKNALLANGVPVNDDAPAHVNLYLEGDYDEKGKEFIYKAEIDVVTRIRLYHNGTWRSLIARIYKNNWSSIITGKSVDEAAIEAAGYQAKNFAEQYKRSRKQK